MGVRAGYKVRDLVLAAAITVLLWATTNGVALAQVSVDEVAAAIEQEYGVTVLRVEEVDTADGKIYAVTVMNPGGAFNEAFQVNTIAVDPASGKRIRPSEAGGGPRSISEESGTTLRRTLGAAR